MTNDKQDWEDIVRVEKIEQLLDTARILIPAEDHATALDELTREFIIVANRLRERGTWDFQGWETEFRDIVSDLFARLARLHASLDRVAGGYDKRGDPASAKVLRDAIGRSRLSMAADYPARTVQ